MCWLRALPHAAVVPWGDDHAGEDAPVCVGWVDVIVPPLQAVALMNWVWTVLPPDDEDVDPSDPLVIVLPEDVDTWERHSDTGPVRLTADPQEPGWRRRRGWTPTAVSRALEAWTAHHAGRSDVTFRWDPAMVSPMAQELQSRFDASDRGSSASFFLGRTAHGADIVIEEGAMDDLLRLPLEDAAMITNALMNLTHPDHDSSGHA